MESPSRYVELTGGPPVRWFVISVIPGVLRFEVKKYIVPKQRFWDI